MSVVAPTIQQMGNGVTIQQYRLFAVIGGLFGIDHLAIGSMESGVAKLFVNMLTFGSWWIFDIIQAFDTNKDYSKGLDIPYYGSTLIGAKMINDSSGATPTSPNAFFYMNILYLIIASVITTISGFLIGKPAPVGQIATAAISISGTLMGILTANIIRQFLPTPSITTPLIQKGGGDTSFMDPILLGTLGLLSIAGFTLAASRA